MNKILSLGFSTFFIVFCVIILALSLRGIPGNPDAKELDTLKWRDEGPLELSPERGRFALIYSLVEDKSFQFSTDIGNFSKPDVGFLNGRFVSLFAPGPSFVALPGYIIGKYFGASQVGAFAVIALFAIFNGLLIKAISRALGATNTAATIAALVFLFATPAFAYAVNLYQHHLSTFLILLALFLLIRFNNFLSLSAIFFLCASGIMIDNPNLFFLFPIGLVGLTRIISSKLSERKITFKIQPLRIFAGLSIIIPLLIFGLSNYYSYGNAFQLAGTVPTPKEIKGEHVATTSAVLNTQAVNPIQSKDKDALRFFKTRHIRNGFYTHFVSADRGILYFTPIMIFSIFGIVLAYKKRVPYTALIISVIGMNILIYSMWGDSYGGWAFGSRYLIPSYALFAVFIGLILSWWNRKWVFIILFLLTLIYSVAINTLGAVTSSRNPPRVEILELEKLTGTVQKYTPERNWDYLILNGSKSFVYQTVGIKYMQASDYYVMICSLIIIYLGSLLVANYFHKERGVK